jgi:hypothetical protein
MPPRPERVVGDVAEQQTVTPISLTEKLLAAMTLLVLGGILFGYGPQVGNTAGSAWENTTAAGHAFYQRVYGDREVGGDDGSSPTSEFPLRPDGTIATPGEVFGQ